MLNGIWEYVPVPSGCSCPGGLSLHQGYSEQGREGAKEQDTEVEHIAQ